MQLGELAAVLFEAAFRVWRRRLIAGAIVFVCLVIALGEGLSAAYLVLVPLSGPVGARLILMGLFLFVIACALVWVVRTERREAQAQADSNKPFGGDEKVAVIAEAIHLGYTLARELKEGRSGNGAVGEQAPTANGAASSVDDPSASVRERP